MGLTQPQDAWLPHLRAPRLPLMPQHRGLYIHETATQARGYSPLTRYAGQRLLTPNPLRGPKAISLPITPNPLGGPKATHPYPATQARGYSPPTRYAGQRLSHSPSPPTR